MRVECTGQGVDGDHCCYTPEGICHFLTENNGRNWCSIWDTIGGIEWLASPMGQHFVVTFPGYTCKDFPQNIPEVMDNLSMGKCCWGSEG